MPSPLRRHILRASSLLIVAACAVACSSEPDGGEEPLGKITDQALTLPPKCAPGYVAVESEDLGPTGKPIISWTCTPASQAGATVTSGTTKPTPLDGAVDTCGSTTIPVPASLPATCTLGMQVDNDYFWACPAGTTAPSSVGRVSTQLGPCASVGSAVDFLGDSCEQVYAVPSTQLPSIQSNCIGNPMPGWELVVDAVAVVAYVPWSSSDGGPSGGCSGGCAKAQPPVSR